MGLRMSIYIVCNCQVYLKRILLKIWQILAFNATLALFFSGALPFVSIHFIGIFSMSLFDLYRGYGVSIPESLPEFTEEFSAVGAGLVLIAILFPISLIVGFASLRIGPKACLIAGSLGMICWSGSLLAIIQLKLSIAQSGGPLGGLVAGLIQIGYGIYSGILGSAILLISYFVAIHEAKKAPVSTSTTDVDFSRQIDDSPPKSIARTLRNSDSALLPLSLNC